VAERLEDGEWIDRLCELAADATIARPEDKGVDAAGARQADPDARAGSIGSFGSAMKPRLEMLISRASTDVCPNWRSGISASTGMRASRRRGSSAMVSILICA
jgi:hypothetical protein